MQNREGQQVVTFKERLLHDALRGVFTYLPPHAIKLLLTAASINPISNTVKIDGDEYYSRNGELWRDKLHIHFPARLRKLIEKENVDWHKEFKKSYLAHYKSLTKNERELFTLVKEGDAEGLDKRLASADIKWSDIIRIKDKNGMSILHWACQHKSASSSLIRCFSKKAELEYAGDPEAKNMMQPLHCAELLALVKKGDAAGLKQRLASLDMKLTDIILTEDRKGKSIVDYACKHADARRSLLDCFYQYAELECAKRPHNKDMITQLHWAAMFDQPPAVIKSLVEKNPAEINEVCLSAGTALHIAAQKGFISVADTLITCGADLAKGTRIGHTALYVAAANGKADMVKLIIEKASSDVINKAGRRGQTPLQIASEKRHAKIAALIEEKLKELNVPSSPKNENTIRMNR